jgi:hypothetical protein
MPTIAQMLAQAKKDAAIIENRRKKAVAKRKSRAIKKTAKSKKRTNPIGLKALGFY